MQVWKYNDKCCLEINDKRIIEQLIYQMKFPKAKLSYLALQNICLTLWI